MPSSLEIQKLPDAVTKTSFVKDSTATIKLTAYEPNYLKYKSNNANEGMAIFSEMYYVPGWNAYIDGKINPYFRANYVLRAMIVPAGNHTIIFKFEPRVFQIGEKVSLASSSLLFLFVLGSVFIFLRKSSSRENHQ